VTNNTENKVGSSVMTQVGIIVHDIEAKAAAWAALFGMPVPEIRLTDGYEITHAEYEGKPTSAQAKLAFFHFDNIDVELIEPVGGPSTWKDQLDQHGDSIHHIAFKIGTVPEMEEKLPAIEAAGLRLVQRGNWAPDGRYLYVDGIAKLGAVLELLPK